MKSIAIIPARSGSKGLRNKNIREINGKPLLAYSVEAALESGVFDVVHVSTDSEIYRNIAIEFGADVPFLRSCINSGDTSSSWDTVKEVINKYKAVGKSFAVCALLQPTSPLRNSADISQAYRLFSEKNADSVVSVCPVDHPIQWCFTLDDSLSMKNFVENPFKDFRRQELNTNYRENGAIYFLKVDKLFKKQFDFYEGSCFAYIMDKKRSIDIDDETDFKLAEVLMQNMRNSD